MFTYSVKPSAPGTSRDAWAMPFRGISIENGFLPFLLLALFSFALPLENRLAREAPITANLKAAQLPVLEHAIDGRPMYAQIARGVFQREYCMSRLSPLDLNGETS